MLRQLLTISGNTFVESIRQPIFAVLIILGGLLMALNTALAAYSMETGGGDNKMLIDLALSTVFLIGILLAAFTATGVLSSEVENKTVLTVVSKPVARPLFVVGKYLGVAGAIALAYYVLSLIIILTLRHRVMSTASDHFDGPVWTFGVLATVIALLVATWANYFYSRVFSSTFVVCMALTQTAAVGLVLVISKQWQLQSPMTDLLARQGEMLQTIVGLGLIFQALLVLTAVAIAASTRLGQVMTLVVCLGLFVLGLISNSLGQLVNQRLNIPHGLGMIENLQAIFAADIEFHQKLIFAATRLGYLLIPNLQFLWPADAITQGNPFSAGHFVTLTVYSLLYVVVILSIAVALFQTREVG